MILLHQKKTINSKHFTQYLERKQNVLILHFSWDIEINDDEAFTKLTISINRTRKQFVYQIDKFNLQQVN